LLQIEKCDGPFGWLQCFSSTCSRLVPCLSHLHKVASVVPAVLNFKFVFVGIGNPPGTMDLRAFLLQKFSSVERKQVWSSLIPSLNWFSTFIIAYTFLCAYAICIILCLAIYFDWNLIAEDQSVLL